MTTKSFNGLNGTIMLNTVPEGIPVGTVDGKAYGYPGRRLSVRVELRLERAERQDTYQTTEHDTVARPLDFACTTSVWRPDGRDMVAGGATREPLREIDRWSNGFDAETARTLADLGDRWHLNAMRAGCAHQTVIWEDSQYGRRPSLELTEPCPISGYRYGHAWLVETLPADFLPRLEAILERTDQTRIYRHAELGGRP